MKLYNPFGNKRLRITQVTHGVKNQLAIDCNAEDNNRNIYAEGEGIVLTAITLGGANRKQSYAQIQYDGIPNGVVAEYVHMQPSVKVGQRVSKGMIIGLLVETYYKADGKTLEHAMHLHRTFYCRTGGTPHPFDYMDHSVDVYAVHPSILAYQNWFINGKFNWNAFKDLSLGETSMAIKVGSNVEFTKVTNLRHDPRIEGEAGVSAKILPGAVGTVIGGPRKYAQAGVKNTYYDVRFLNEQGWCFDANMVVTTKPVTNIDGSIPKPPVVEPPIDPPKPVDDDIKELQREVEALKIQDMNLKKDITVLSRELDSVKNSMLVSGDTLRVEKTK